MYAHTLSHPRAHVVHAVCVTFFCYTESSYEWSPGWIFHNPHKCRLKRRRKNNNQHIYYSHLYFTICNILFVSHAERAWLRRRRKKNEILCVDENSIYYYFCFCMFQFLFFPLDHLRTMKPIECRCSKQCSEKPFIFVFRFFRIIIVFRAMCT